MMMRLDIFIRQALDTAPAGDVPLSNCIRQSFPSPVFDVKCAAGRPVFVERLSLPAWIVASFCGERSEVSSGLASVAAIGFSAPRDRFAAVPATAVCRGVHDTPVHWTASDDARLHSTKRSRARVNAT